MKKIPKVFSNMNLYNMGEKMIGINSEVTLPNLEPITETMSGAGIAGEIEVWVPGHFGPIPIEVPFRIAHQDAYDLLAPGRKTLVLRTAIQSEDLVAGKDVLQGQKVTISGNPKGIDLGKVSPGKAGESKVTLDATYLKVEIDNKVMLEIDKINMIYVVNGVDYLEEHRNLI